MEERDSLIILGAISLLHDYGYDFEKNSAISLICSVQELLQLCQKDDDLRQELMDAIEDLKEIRKRKLN